MSMQITITAPWHEFRAAVDVLHFARTHGLCPNELEWALAEECLTPPLPSETFTTQIYSERAFRAVQTIIECVAAEPPNLPVGICVNALKLAAKLNELVHIVEADDWNYWKHWRLSRSLSF